ncbi:hypothetical protein Y032_0050g1952 [Ancylostoma ceylanicum]|uniref:Secreted protein n=1 Tax=Ancylostoma ceylanicum TaxID=53326 RepID=A0A016U9J2_9BILA|nr:hypothetical protein Y032_0050g1952 [Ancylostoma ceylanicum]
MCILLVFLFNFCDSRALFRALFLSGVFSTVFHGGTDHTYYSLSFSFLSNEVAFLTSRSQYDVLYPFVSPLFLKVNCRKYGCIYTQ